MITALSFLFSNFIESNEKSQLNWQSLLLSASFIIHLGIASCALFAPFLSRLFEKKRVVFNSVAECTCDRTVLVNRERLNVAIVSNYKD